MLLVRLTKGQRSPRTSLAFGDHFASFTRHPLARKFTDERETLLSFHSTGSDVSSTEWQNKLVNSYTTRRIS